MIRSEEIEEAMKILHNKGIDENGNEYERLKKQKEDILERQRRSEIKEHPLVKYVLDRGIISVRMLCKIMDCDIEDVTVGL